MSELASQKFGRLLALGPAGKNVHGAILWRFRCDCGTEKVTYLYSVTTGRILSCGCLSRERATANCRARSKGFDRSSPEYLCWVGMRSRCRQKKGRKFRLYAGRGIKVCERWNDFSSFLKDMGARPKWATSIDRIDTNGNYEPGNCRWADWYDQANNKRTNRIVNYRGIDMTLAEAARIAEPVVTKRAVSERLAHGWPVDRALEAPRHPRS